MIHIDPQFDTSIAFELAKQNSEAQTMRRFGAWATCFIVLVILASHWLGMHWFVSWMGGEASLAHGQTEHEQTVLDQTVNGQVANAPSVDDGWRRTAKGWEYLPHEAAHPIAGASLPTMHWSPNHFWPAAAAACMLLLIAGLPDDKSPAIKSAEAQNSDDRNSDETISDDITLDQPREEPTSIIPSTVRD